MLHTAMVTISIAVFKKLNCKVTQWPKMVTIGHVVIGQKYLSLPPFCRHLRKLLSNDCSSDFVNVKVSMHYGRKSPDLIILNTLKLLPSFEEFPHPYHCKWLVQSSQDAIWHNIDTLLSSLTIAVSCHVLKCRTSFAS